MVRDRFEAFLAAKISLRCELQPIINEPDADPLRVRHERLVASNSTRFQERLEEAFPFLLRRVRNDPVGLGKSLSQGLCDDRFIWRRT